MRVLSPASLKQTVEETLDTCCPPHSGEYCAQLKRRRLVYPSPLTFQNREGWELAAAPHFFSVEKPLASPPFWSHAEHTAASDNSVLIRRWGHQSAVSSPTLLDNHFDCCHCEGGSVSGGAMTKVGALCVQLCRVALCCVSGFWGFLLRAEGCH